MASEPALRLPSYSSMDDDELMRATGEEFARAIIDKARQWAREVMDRSKFRMVRELDAEERRTALIKWNQSHAWLEWWLGVPPPARQIVLLTDEDLPLKLRLGQQIIDEIKHQRVHSHRVNLLGGDARLENYAPKQGDAQSQKVTFNDTPLGIAASLQCTGEVVLYEVFNPDSSILFDLVDEATKQDIIKDVAPEEPRHIKIGEDLVAKYAVTPALRRQVAQVQDAKLSSLYVRYCEDYALFGAERTAAAPVL